MIERPYLSVECEYPCVDERGAPVPPDLFQVMWDGLSAAGWTGDAFGVSRTLAHNPAVSKDQQVLTTDAGPLLEVVTSPRQSIDALATQWRTLMDLTRETAASQGVRLLASGVHPTLTCDQDSYLRFRTPRQPYDYANNLRGWHHRSVVNIASTQELIDVPIEMAPRVAGFLQKLAGFVLFLCRNDPGLHERYLGKLSIRPEAWRWHIPPLGRFSSDRHRVWLPERQISTWKDYLELLLTKAPMFMLGTKNHGLVYVRAHPTLEEFLAEDVEWDAAKVTGSEPCRLRPAMEHLTGSDWTYMGFARLRWRWKKDLPPLATFNAVWRSGDEDQIAAFMAEHLDKVFVENRSSATPPKGEEFASLAFILGLLTRFEEAERVLTLSYAEALAVAYQSEWLGLASVEGTIRTILDQLMAVAEQGLVDRGLGEEVYLDPLVERLGHRSSPAEDMMRMLSTRGLQGLIDHLSY